MCALSTQVDVTSSRQVQTQCGVQLQVIPSFVCACLQGRMKQWPHQQQQSGNLF
jgi:hypothetical protein